MWLLHLFYFGFIYTTAGQNTTAASTTVDVTKPYVGDALNVSRPSTDPDNGTILFDQIYSDYLICANHRNRDGSFTYEKCPRYPKTGFFPLCVYMTEPSTQNKSGTNKYGCVYARDLPHECVANGSFFWEYQQIEIGGKKYSGAGICCSDNFCNEREDPLFSFVRLREDRNETHTYFGKHGIPLLLAAFIVLAGLIPLCSGKLLERHQRGVLRAESPGFLDDEIGGHLANKRRVKEVEETVTQNMNFAGLKKMQQTVKDILSPYKYGFTHSSTYLMMAARMSGSAPLPGAAVSVEAAPEDEEKPREYKELIVNDTCKVFQRCGRKTCEVKREIASKYEHLVQRLIEHGPYRYDFDPVELGDLFDSVANVFSAEPSLLELEPDISIYGNLEGSYGDLFRWLHKNGWPPKRKVLFLGGVFNEQEPYSLETIALIFAMKVLMPDQVFMLRGAAETKPMCLEEGRYARRVTNCLQEVLYRACAFLPLAATVGPVFCSHGGFPWNLKELKQAAGGIKRPLYNVKKGSIAAQLIFSQAGPQEGPIPGCRGRGFSKDTRPDLPCKNADQTFSLFVRARNVCTSGYLFVGESILNLWSVAGNPTGNTGGASLYIDREMNATLNKMTPFGTYTADQLKEYEEKQKKHEALKKKLVMAKKSTRQTSAAPTKAPKTDRGKFKSSDDPTKSFD